MKKAVCLVFVMCLVLVVNSVFADGKLLRGEKWQRFSNESTDADFYVSTEGNDTWSGTLAQPKADKTDGPFATIHRAQQAVRELKANVFKPKEPPVETRWIGSPHELGRGKDILVLIRDGYYSLSSPVIFTPFDGGERVETNLPTGAFEYHKLKDHYVTYAAYPGEKPVISGGKKINGWQKENNYWVTNYKNEEIAQLVVNGIKQTLARTPNKGYFTPPKIASSKQQLCFSPDQLKDWPDKEGNRVIMLLRWHRGVNTITKIDESKGIATFKRPQKGVDVVPPRFYVENVKSLLDAPGEWFLDQNEGKLYFIPPVSVNDPNKASVVNSHLNSLFKVTGSGDRPVRNLRFYGLSFEAIRGGAAVSFEYAHACEVVDSDMQSLGGTGVKVSKGCYQTKILGNSFKTVDNSAVAVTGNPYPEDWADIVRETVVSYNRAEDCDGTSIYAANTLFTTISHNEVTDNRGRYSISVGGWSNLEEAIEGGYRVEYNHCHNVQKLADDSGVIKTAGLTYDSILRRNLVHDVKAGYFNDNVGFWFDNMSSGWLSEENIFYDLQQGEMKLCAANLVDNIYKNNFVIEAPEIKPEGIIMGDPVFEYDELSVDILDGGDNSFSVGDYINVSTKIKNSGSSGLLPVNFMYDGKVSETQLFPVIRNNKRTISFVLRLDRPGNHRFAIGSTDEKIINVSGAKLSMVVEDFKLSQKLVAVGESVTCSAIVTNLDPSLSAVTVPFLVDDKEIDKKVITAGHKESKEISFVFNPKAGSHALQIGNSLVENISAFAHKAVNIKKAKIKTHISGTARGSKVDVNKKNNKFKITATGTDFYHAEDSYAAAYIENVTGNFVATVKATAFGPRTHEWFRSGLFARNAIEKSFDTEPGSKGSVLMFTSPSRAGINWDEFGDGCMHKAASENLPQDSEYPIWIKLIRRGDSFSGYISLDGENWIIERHANNVPGIQKSIDLGLAAGSCDEKPYWVEFEDFTLQVED